MSISDGWNHKDEWRRSGQGFMVVVSRHHFGDGEISEDENRWCVYAYVYPKHRIFDRLDKADNAGVLRDCCGLYCHSYVSLYRVHRDESGTVQSVQIGWDYNHDGDEFSTRKTPGEASVVFWHASRLFDQLDEMGRETCEVTA